MKTIGFIGTAKNTGKTTTALHVLQLGHNAGLKIALTSIGFDGENLDNVTGLPKPRYYVEAGTIIATAQRCLSLGSAGYRPIVTTPVQTILGQVEIVEVNAAGYVVLAGPNRRVDLLPVLQQFAELGVDLAMVDGALNRMAPVIVADGLVISSGAAYDERIPVLVKHTASIAGLFAYHKIYVEGEIPSRITVRQDGRTKTELALGSLLDQGMLDALSQQLYGGASGQVIIPGACVPQLFEKLLRQLPASLEGLQFLFSNPLNLIVSGNPAQWQKNLTDLTARGGAAGYLETIPLHFMTVNPFFPRYLQKTSAYVADYLDKVELLETARSQIDFPVFDIYQPPLPDLLELIGISNS